MVAVIGRPNVGKSTLVNALVGERVSITSRKPQTTRDRILGVRTDADAQYIFVDTPGFQRRHRSALNKRMNEAVTGALDRRRRDRSGHRRSRLDGGRRHGGEPAASGLPTGSSSR